MAAARSRSRRGCPMPARIPRSSGRPSTSTACAAGAAGPPETQPIAEPVRISSVTRKTSVFSHGKPRRDHFRGHGADSAALYGCREGGVPRATLELVHCSFGVDSGASRPRRRARGTSASSLPRPGGRRRTSPTPSALPWSWPKRSPGGPTAPTVPGELWERVSEHYDEKGLASLLLRAAATKVPGGLTGDE